MGLSESQRRWTLQRAVDAFHAKYPLGFSDPSYLGSRGERKDKWTAHELFVKQFGECQGLKYLSEGNVSEITQKAMLVISKAKMLLSYECAALSDALKDQQAAFRFFSALFKMLDSAVVTQEVYQPYIDAVIDLPQEEGKAKVATWPVTTLLPFIAQPDKHMFLKPVNIKTAAEALDFDLNYHTKPNWQTYKALLEMSKVCFYEVKHLGPRDMIDVQSFFWLAGHQ